MFVCVFVSGVCIHGYAIHYPKVAFSCRKAGAAVAELQTRGGADAQSDRAMGPLGPYTRLSIPLKRARNRAKIPDPKHKSAREGSGVCSLGRFGHRDSF